MLKSIWSCAVCVHVEISQANNYHVYEQNYTITIDVVNFSIWSHATHIQIFLLFAYLYIICICICIYIFSSCAAILSLIAYHLQS